MDYKLIAQQQHNWVRKLEKIAIAPIMVSCSQSDGITPSIRYLANEHDWWHHYQYIRCMDNELVFDIDERDWGLIRIYTKPLIKHLKKKGIPFTMAGSGGNGIHCEIFFDALDYQKLYGFRQVREVLWNYILDEIGVDEGLRGAGRPYCNAVICFGDRSEYGRIVRDFGGNKMGNYKTLIKHLPRKRESIYDKSYCVFPEYIMIWKPSIDILESLDLKPRRKNNPLNCYNCPVDRDFIYEQSHYLDEWGDLRVRVNVCSNCGGEIGDE